VAAISAWVANPSAERSQLPAMAIERFGLMAPLPLPDSSLQAVAEWVWDMYDPAAGPHATGKGGRGGMHGEGGMRGQGRGMGMHALPRDTRSN